MTKRPAAQPTVQVDNDRVLVTEWRFQPGAETTWHRHSYDYVVVPMTDCHFLIEDAAGERRVMSKAGEAYRRDAGVEHNVINGGSEPMSFIEIEYK